MRTCLCAPISYLLCRNNVWSKQLIQCMAIICEWSWPTASSRGRREILAIYSLIILRGPCFIYIVFIHIGFLRARLILSLCVGLLIIHQCVCMYVYSHITQAYTWRSRVVVFHIDQVGPPFSPAVITCEFGGFESEKQLLAIAWLIFHHRAFIGCLSRILTRCSTLNEVTWIKCGRSWILDDVLIEVRVTAEPEAWVLAMLAQALEEMWSKKTIFKHHSQHSLETAHSWRFKNAAAAGYRSPRPISTSVWFLIFLGM